MKKKIRDMNEEEVILKKKNSVDSEQVKYNRFVNTWKASYGTLDVVERSTYWQKEALHRAS